MAAGRPDSKPPFCVSDLFAHASFALAMFEVEPCPPFDLCSALGGMGPTSGFVEVLPAVQTTENPNWFQVG